jgi:hypothetical protein
MPKRLKNLEVEYISLVAAPATGLPLILKNEQAKATLFELQKTDDERQVAYGVVYAPGVIDSQGDFADAIEIESAAYRFMKAKRVEQVDENHNFQAIDGAYVAESWLVKEGDPWFGFLPGAWAVGVKVDNADVWERLKKGELWGFSMAGQAEREEVMPPEQNPTGGESFSKADLDAALTAIKATMAAQLQDALAGLTGLPDQLAGLEQRLGAVEKARLTVAHQPTPGPDKKQAALRSIL